MADQQFVEGRTKFYTDDELIAMFGVSRMTIRQAVQVLVDEGILERIQGKGTFIVKKKKMETDIERLDTFFRGWYLEQDFSVELLVKQVVPCPDKYCSRLGLTPESEVIQVKRRRLSKGVPVVVDNRYMLKEFGDKISDEELVRYSFSEIFLRKFNLKFSEGTIEIEATLADEKTAELLTVPIGSPILYRRIELMVDHHGCIFVGESSYRGDMFKYKSVLRSK